MARKHHWIYIVMLVTVLPVIAPLSLGARQSSEWTLVQNGSQDYALYCPKSAVVQRYDPEGILHITLPVKHQVMMIRIHDDLASLSHYNNQLLTENNKTLLVRAIQETFGLPAKAKSFSQISTGKNQAIAVEWSGELQRSRFTFLLAGDRVYSINYPLGQPENEATFERIIETFSIETTLQDKGFEIVQTDSEAISALSVPHYYQNDSQWVCDQLGSCTTCSALPKWTCPSKPTITTIGDAGCAITSYAMIFEYYTTAHYKTPLELDTCYTTHGEYSNISGCGHCGRHWANLNSSACKPSSVTYIGETTDRSVVDADLQSGYPLIGELPSGDGYHYVVVIGKSGSNYQVHDPVINNPSERSSGSFTKFVRFQGSLPVATPAWNFSNDSQGWSVTNGLSDSHFVDGGWWHRVSADDPHITGPMINVPADDYPYIFLQMASLTDSCGEIYFATQSSPSFTGEKYVNLPITANGGTERLIVDMRSNPYWTGNIIQLRLDPACHAVNSQAVRIDLLMFTATHRVVYLPLVKR